MTSRELVKQHRAGDYVHAQLYLLIERLALPRQICTMPRFMHTCLSDSAAAAGPAWRWRLL